MRNKTRNLCVFLTTLLMAASVHMNVFAQAEDVTDPTVMTEPAEEEVQLINGEDFSTDTDFVTRDLLFDKATNKQFITVQDRNGNVFYVVIDYDAPINEEEEQYQTYFLNPVDAADLKALTGEEETEPATCICTEKCVPGKVNMNCPVCSKNMGECAGKEIELSEETEETTAPTVPEPVEIEQTTKIPPAAVAGLILLIIGGIVFVLIKVKKGKKDSQKKNTDDYDFDDILEEDEPENQSGENDEDSENTED